MNVAQMHAFVEKPEGAMERDGTVHVWADRDDEIDGSGVPVVEIQSPSDLTVPLLC